MPVRRSADPMTVQHVWDAIRSANAQKQMADYSRIVKYLQKVDNCTTMQAELYLKQTLSDGLILNLNKVVAKGANVGAAVESYKIPMNEIAGPEMDGRDWYCIDCHLAGDVLECRTCFRVYHRECANKKYNEYGIANPQALNPVDRLTYLSTNNNLSSKEIDSHDSSQEESLLKMNEPVGSSFNTTNKENEVQEVEDVSSSKEDLNETKEKPHMYDLTLCSICNMWQSETKVGLQKEELNYLLSFVFKRIKTWLPMQVTDTMSTEGKPEWLTKMEVAWRAKQLLFCETNMAVVASNLESHEYTSMSQFQSDLLAIQHNIAIFHGTESQEYGASMYTLQDCAYDIKEITNCSDCYRNSNEKINNKWFCLPCKVPHKLVWAKQKGYSYWPAKVLSETEKDCDVRFFGSKYERSIIPKERIKPITIEMRTLQIKRSTAFNKAMNELSIHQKMLADPNVVHQYSNLKRKKKISVKPMLFEYNDSMASTSFNSSSGDVYNFSSDVLADSETSLRNDSMKLLRKRKRSNEQNMKKTVLRGPLPKVYVMDYKAKERPSKQDNQYVENVIDLSGFNEEKTNFKVNQTSENVLDLTSFNDDDEEEEENRYSNQDNHLKFKLDCNGSSSSYQEVSSSTEQLQRADEPYTRDNSDGLMPEPDRQYSESVEKTRRQLELCTDKKQLIKVALECMQGEIDKINNAHEEYIKSMVDLHAKHISETKKKQWCYNCEQDAIYHCCWNTAYCSPACQQQHWQDEHKKVCRRKR